MVTTGEGGAVTTDDGDLADRLRRLRSHGGVAGPAVGLTFVEHGFNYRLGAVPATLGLAQLRRLDAILADRRATATRHEERLGDLAGVEVRRPRGRGVLELSELRGTHRSGCHRGHLVRPFAKLA